MLGLGNRRKYNGSVDTKLNREYQISTRGNPSFLNLSQYTDVLNKAFNLGISEDEAALYLAILYYSYQLEKSNHTEADRVLQLINSIGEYNLKIGAISRERWDDFYSYVDKAQVSFMMQKSSLGGLQQDDDLETPESQLVAALAEIKADYGFDMQSFAEQKDFKELYLKSIQGAHISGLAHYSFIGKLVAFSVLADGANRRMDGLPVAKGDLAWTVGLIERSESFAPKDSYDGKAVTALFPTINDDLDTLLSYFGLK